MRAARVLAALVTAVAAPLALGAQPVTSANWSRHPAVAEVRAIYREIAAAEAAGRLRKQQRKFEFCQPYADTGRTLHLDARGAVRSYRFAGGSEDSTAERALYYDRDGHLRFVLIRAGARQRHQPRAPHLPLQDRRAALGELGPAEGPRLHVSQPMAAERPGRPSQTGFRRREPVSGAEVRRSPRRFPLRRARRTTQMLNG
jgi:hypothetical protein